ELIRAEHQRVRMAAGDRPGLPQGEHPDRVLHRRPRRDVLVHPGRLGDVRDAEPIEQHPARRRGGGEEEPHRPEALTCQRSERESKATQLSRAAGVGGAGSRGCSSAMAGDAACNQGAPPPGRTAAAGSSVRLGAMVRRLGLLCFLTVATACHRVAPADGPPKTAVNNPRLPTGRGPPPRARAPGGPRAGGDRRGLVPLDAARAAYDAREYERALSCAAEASARAPDEPDAHSERGAALSALGKFDEAKLAYAR